MRQVLAREAPVVHDGPHHRLPYDGPGAVGLGKPLRSIVHPLRADLPIWLGAEGPRNVALAAEIADGWIPLFFSPSSAGLYEPWLAEGFARPGARHTRETFEVAASCHLQVVRDAEEKRVALQALKPLVALYMGGMGARGANFHHQVFVRMGHGDLADEVQRLYLEGATDEAAALVPDALVDDLHVVGTEDEVVRRVGEWEAAGVTTLLLALTSPEEVRRVGALLA